jgi:arsenite methyltransferase
MSVPGGTVLDVGSGFGPVPMELAAIAPVRAVGVDVDAEVLKAAESLEASAAKAGGFSPGRDIRFEVGDAYALPRPDKSLDRATARFVFQPLVDPPSAGAELARVVRRGGLAWLIDVDEGLSFSHPPGRPPIGGWPAPSVPSRKSAAATAGWAGPSRP